MLKQLTYTAIIAVIAMTVLWPGALPDRQQFSQANQTLQVFLLPAIFVVVMISLALLVVAVKAPYLVTEQRINQFAWISRAGLAAVFFAALAYIKLAP